MVPDDLFESLPPISSLEDDGDSVEPTGTSPSSSTNNQTGISNKSSLSILQEWCQLNKTTPVFVELSATGPPHCRK